MSAIPIFDRVKFAKVGALYASTPYAGLSATPPTARWNFSQEPRGSPLSRRPTWPGSRECALKIRPGAPELLRPVASVWSTARPLRRPRRERSVFCGSARAADIPGTCAVGATSGASSAASALTGSSASSTLQRGRSWPMTQLPSERGSEVLGKAPGGALDGRRLGCAPSLDLPIGLTEPITVVARGRLPCSDCAGARDPSLRDRGVRDGAEPAPPNDPPGTAHQDPRSAAWKHCTAACCFGARNPACALRTARDRRTG